MPRDTSKMSPEEVLFRGLTEGPSKSIENLEAEGQRELVAEGGTRLPTELLGITEETLKSLGFILGPVVEGDPLFREGALPPGWEVEATGYIMHSEITDANSVRRGGIFYKAASYDRGAHLTLDRRFNVRTDYPKDVALELPKREGVWDNLKNDWRFRTEPMTQEQRWQSNHKECNAWLAEHYPDHEDVTKYWDEES